jgi:hypothetical protein
MIHEQDLGQANVDWIDRTKALAEFGITKPDQKGDVGGHAFHGNRYTGGIGGSSQAARDAAEEAMLDAALERQSANKLAVHPKPYKVKVGGVTSIVTPQSANPAVRALHTYQGSGSDAMNLRLREGFQASVADGRNQDAQIKAIDSLMRPLTEAKVLYRAIGLGGLEEMLGSRVVSPKFNGQMLHDALNELKGSIINDKGFTSTTSDKEVGGGKAYHGEVLVQLDVPAGTKAIDIVGRDLGDTDYNFEKEVLLAHGGSYRIDGVSDQPDPSFGSEYPVYVLHMTAVAA